MNRQAVAFAFLCLLVAIPARGRAEGYPSKELMMRMYSFHQEARANGEYAKGATSIELKLKGDTIGIVQAGNAVIGFRSYRGKSAAVENFVEIFRGKVYQLGSGGAVTVLRDEDKRFTILPTDLFMIQVKKAEPPPLPLGFTFTAENWMLLQKDGVGTMKAVSGKCLKIAATPGNSVRSYNLNRLEGDFTASVMIEKTMADSPDEFGMVFVDAKATARDVLRFSLASPGHSRIVQGSGEENEKKAEWKPLRKSTEAGKFRLVVKRVGTRYEMWVNDEKGGEVDLGVPAIVHPGLFVTASESGDEGAKGVEVEFSEFNVVKGEAEK